MVGLKSKNSSKPPQFHEREEKNNYDDVNELSSGEK